MEARALLALLGALLTLRFVMSAMFLVNRRQRVLRGGVDR